MAKPNVSLNGRVAVITGSTRGIGLAIAERYGAAGAQVVICSNLADAVAQTAADLRKRGVDASGFTCDVSQRSQVEGLLRHALAAYGVRSAVPDHDASATHPAARPLANSFVSFVSFVVKGSLPRWGRGGGEVKAKSRRQRDSRRQRNSPGAPVITPVVLNESVLY